MKHPPKLLCALLLAPLAALHAAEPVTNSIGMKLVRIEPGTFTMGQDGPPMEDYLRQKRFGEMHKDFDRIDFDEKPAHKVTITQPFLMSVTEVTVAQYLACVQDGGCKEPEWREAGSQYHYQTGSNTYYRDTNALQADSPITGVSWANAKAYVAWLSRKTGQTFTLPTEAQWEYAARGGQTGRWYFGDNESQLKDHAWYSDNAGGKLHPVGSTRLSAHPWGLKDMAGNAWEWVEDCWHGNYTNAPSSGDKAWEGANGGECGLRLVRGGSWYIVARNSRAAHRDRYSTGFRNYNLSFRPARMLP